MKLIYLIAVIFSLTNCGAKDTSKAVLDDPIEKTEISESIDAPQLRGQVILYDMKTGKVKDTLSLNDIVFSNPIDKSSYPSSQKDTSVCDNWKVDDQTLKEILKNSTPISSGVWHYAYDHLACSYLTEFSSNNKKYKMSINGGSWISISAENIEGKIGCPEKECMEFFLSEPISLDDSDSKN